MKTLGLVLTLLAVSFTLAGGQKDAANTAAAGRSSRRIVFDVGERRQVVQRFGLPRPGQARAEYKGYITTIRIT